MSIGPTTALRCDGIPELADAIGHKTMVITVMGRHPLLDIFDRDGY